MTTKYLNDIERRNKVYDLRDKLRPIRDKLRGMPIPTGEYPTDWDFLRAARADILAELAKLDDPLIGLYD